MERRDRVLLSEATIITMTEEQGSSELHFKGWVGIEGNRIVMVTRSKDEAEAFRRTSTSLDEIDCRGKVVMPGLINTHCHVAMTLQRSYADDIPLMEWLYDYIWPFEGCQSGDDVKLGAELGIVEMLLGGVTTFVDMYWDENRIAEAANELGIRALLCPSCLDSNMDKFEEDLKELLKRCNDRVRAGIGPHAPYTVSRENLLRCKSLSEEHDIPLTIHLSETLDEVRSVNELSAMTPTKYLDSLGLLSERTIAAHCVHIDDEDREILRQRGVKIAHNPTSNMKISSGIAPLAAYEKDSMHPTIGTDGTCSNNDLDMWEEMRQASFLAKVSSMNPLVLPAYEVLRMATRYGAEAIGRGDELGVIKCGALADLIVIDILKPHLQPVHNLISNLVYCCKSSDVESVIVDGRVVVRERKIEGIDLLSLYDRAATAVERITSEVRAKR